MVVSLHFSPYAKLPSTRQLVFETRNDSIFPLFKHIDLITFVTSLKHLMIPPYRISPFHISYHHSTCAITIPHSLTPFHICYHHSTCAITIPHALSQFHIRYHHSTFAITIPHALSPFHMCYHHSTCPIIIPHALSPFHMRN